MKIYRNLDDLQYNENCVLTTGTFDGVHLGHQTIIRKLQKTAEKNGGCSTVVTFEPHPQFVVKPHKKDALKLLTSLDEKIDIFEKLKIDRLIIIPFTEEFSRLSSTEFIENILLKKIGLKKIIVGYDHAFGKGRQGNFEILENFSKQYDFSIIKMPPFSVEGFVISSTKIRKLIADGKIEQAAKYLGRHYKLTGKVVKGEGRGNTYGIPTANILPVNQNKLIPQDGIYAGWVTHKDQRYKAVLYIGKKPTFAYNKLTMEVYLFSFTGNLYDETLDMEFKTKIRDDQKFDNIEELYQQIQRDKKKTLEILSCN